MEARLATREEMNGMEFMADQVSGPLISGSPHVHNCLHILSCPAQEAYKGRAELYKKLVGSGSTGPPQGASQLFFHLQLLYLLDLRSLVMRDTGHGVHNWWPWVGVIMSSLTDEEIWA